MQQPILQSDDNDENSEIEGDQGHEKNIYHSTTKGYFLEFALICLFFGNNLPSTLLQNQILKLTCQSFDEYNDTICNALSQNDNSTKEVEERLQPFVAEILMTNTLINTIGTAILSLFLGPYSDVFGRKKILNSTFCGFSLTLTLFALITYISENQRGLSPWTYTIAYLPQVLSGGWSSLLTAVLCYVTDTNEESKRGYRLTMVEAIIFLGVFLGNMSCNFILPRTDTTQVFVISASIAALATVIVFFCVDESINVPDSVTICDQLKNLVSSKHIVAMIKACFKKRLCKGRRILLCLISMLVLTVFTFNGSASVSYLFERERFGWKLPQHNLYDSSNIILSISGCIIGLTVLKKYLKFSDMALIFLSISSGILDSSLKAFASVGWQMYAISCIALFRILASPMIRTMITTIVPQSEIGKVFAATTSFEALSSLASSPLYTIVYSKTMILFPGAFFLITACVYILNFLLATFVTIMKRTRESHISPYVRIID